MHIAQPCSNCMVYEGSRDQKLYIQINRKRWWLLLKGTHLYLIDSVFWYYTKIKIEIRAFLLISNCSCCWILRRRITVSKRWLNPHFIHTREERNLLLVSDWPQTPDGMMETCRHAKFHFPVYSKNIRSTTTYESFLNDV